MKKTMNKIKEHNTLFIIKRDLLNTNFDEVIPEII